MSQGLASRLLSRDRTVPEWATALSVRPDTPHAADDEFDGDTIGASWTRVVQGSPVGTWVEKHGMLTYELTANGTADTLDVWAKSMTIPTGTTLEIAARVWKDQLSGPWLGFSNGTTYGTSNAVGSHLLIASGIYRVQFNNWPGHNTRATDGTEYNYGRPGTIHYFRVTYESANTWGSSYSTDGVVWHAGQTGYSYTMTPTHVVVGWSNIFVTQNAPSGCTIEYFRVNPT